MPCWNEEGKVGPGVKAVPKSIVDTVCVVDNGSIDGTAAEAVRAGAFVISHQLILEQAEEFVLDWNMADRINTTY